MSWMTCVLASCLALMASVSAAQELPPAVASAWRAYVAAAEARIAGGRGQAIPRRPGVERGDIVIEEVSTRRT